jgi:hypothetical protein
LSALGTTADSARFAFGSWIVGAILTAVFAVGGFALSCFLISWIGKALFNAETDFNELVRTLGLAYVWNVIGFLGILGLFSQGLSCLTSLPRFAAWIAGLVAWIIAAKEALDLEWGETIVTILLGWIAAWIVNWIPRLILGRTLLGMASRYLQ